MRRRGKPQRERISRPAVSFPFNSRWTASMPPPTRTFEARKPMTAEQQLERSVLEGKEREELQAIAQALSVKTNTRTKKADMIDGILKATGVSAEGGPGGEAA